jgi:A/G-specific adenine glycosylase
MDIDTKFYTSTLLNWYQTNRRDLPWRFSNNPYEIWIAEVIFQQTRINQGINYYHRFIERFPNISILANASEDEVLKLWQGLGYYPEPEPLVYSKKVHSKCKANLRTLLQNKKNLKGLATNCSRHCLYCF